ncbi:hypothetical protein PoB_002110500 [Plakobranchus ocellatus]|uniref:Uncharacterized protein n=1 Tax=Plakobranchus ocellatus TaxID=259542 RepID=A0AAV3ZJ62_9GAST|nr:hypothetical protein PoB_002110500 [Plakobranchus ocellatus]
MEKRSKSRIFSPIEAVSTSLGHQEFYCMQQTAWHQLGRVDCPPTALPSFRPTQRLGRGFRHKSIAAMLWLVAVSEDEFAEVSHGSKFS